MNVKNVCVFFCCFLRTIGDRIGEGKASGNLGNTLKVLGRFDEAVVCCQRHLDISQEQGDKVTSMFLFFIESPLKPESYNTFQRLLHVLFIRSM